MQRREWGNLTHLRIYYMYAVTQIKRNSLATILISHTESLTGCNSIEANIYSSLETLCRNSKADDS